ncbi:methionine synthase reductase [Cydia strobilella]|uniref:methionine synthase reductase n=1 Tax=Cydia strobilella TaxID=1100964 RepID=UPI003003C6E6
MVVTYHYQDMFDEALKAESITLPACKDSGLKLEYLEIETCDVTEPVYKETPPLPFARSKVYQAQILRSRRLTSVNADCMTVYEVTFNVKESNFEFKAGDTIGILPQNSPEDVNAILDHLGITQGDQRYNLTVDSSSKTKLPGHVPVRSTLRHVLTCCLDLRGVLKKLLLLAISKHTKCDTERKTLEYLCSKEGAAAYTKHILNRGICILDIFTIFKTCRPPINLLLANLPRLLPRPYSIVNSGVKASNTLKICFSVMALDNNRKGLTTGWLESQILNDTFEKRMENLSITNDSLYRVPMYVRKNMAEFSLPHNIENPLLLIATGTGIAPFIGFLEERELMKSKNSKMGEVWLFFGCRNPNLDYLYQEELEQYEDNLTLTKLVTAFSRIQNEEARRIQDALNENGRDVARLIEQGASVFVCGEAKTMVAQVKECITSYLVEYSSKTQDEAKQCISQMEKDKQYVVDLWS